MENKFTYSKHKHFENEATAPWNGHTNTSNQEHDTIPKPEQFDSLEESSLHQIDSQCQSQFEEPRRPPYSYDHGQYIQGLDEKNQSQEEEVEWPINRNTCGYRGNCIRLPLSQYYNLPELLSDWSPDHQPDLEQNTSCKSIGFVDLFRKRMHYERLGISLTSLELINMADSERGSRRQRCAHQQESDSGQRSCQDNCTQTERPILGAPSRSHCGHFCACGHLKPNSDPFKEDHFPNLCSRDQADQVCTGHRERSSTPKKHHRPPSGKRHRSDGDNHWHQSSCRDQPDQVPPSSPRKMCRHATRWECCEQISNPQAFNTTTSSQYYSCQQMPSNSLAQQGPRLKAGHSQMGNPNPSEPVNMGCCQCHLGKKQRRSTSKSLPPPSSPQMQPPLPPSPREPLLTRLELQRARRSGYRERPKPGFRQINVESPRLISPHVRIPFGKGPLNRLHRTLKIADLSKQHHSKYEGFDCDVDVLLAAGSPRLLLNEEQMSGLMKSKPIVYTETSSMVQIPEDSEDSVREKKRKHGSTDTLNDVWTNPSAFSAPMSPRTKKDRMSCMPIDALAVGYIGAPVLCEQAARAAIERSAYLSREFDKLSRMERAHTIALRLQQLRLFQDKVNSTFVQLLQAAGARDSRGLDQGRASLKHFECPLRAAKCPLMTSEQLLAHFLKVHLSEPWLALREIYERDHVLIMFQPRPFKCSHNICLSMIVYAGSKHQPNASLLPVCNKGLPGDHAQLAGHVPLFVMACRMQQAQEIDAATDKAELEREQHGLALWMVSMELLRPLHVHMTVFNRRVDMSRVSNMQVRGLNKCHNSDKFTQSSKNFLRLTGQDLRLLTNDFTEPIYLELSVRDYGLQMARNRPDLH